MNNSTLLGTAWELENPQTFHPLWFEKQDYSKWKDFMATNWKLPFYASIAYLAVVFSIQHFMRNRQPFKLQRVLILWNVTLGMFSVLGFIRVTPEFLKILSSPDGFHKSVCIREGLNHPSATWGLLFAFSKYVELGDTLFIVLRKQPLIFLQWYHHCTSMILAWQMIPYAEPIQRYYGWMNYGIHGLMYPYFALKAMKFFIPRRCSMVLTILQLLQMVVGVGVNFYSAYVISTGEKCARHPDSIKWISSVYGSFLLLFAYFLYQTYFSKHKKL